MNSTRNKLRITKKTIYGNNYVNVLLKHISGAPEAMSTIVILVS